MTGSGRPARVVHPDAATIAEAAILLRAGRLVAFPTETVYGLGGIASSDEAIARIYTAKSRPAGNPLIVHCLDRDAAALLGRFDARADRLAEAFWPGALTLVLPLRPDAPLSPRLTAGLDTVALRVPAHPIARALLAATILPVAAPSANPSGRLSPTTAAHVAAALGDAVELVLDGGPCPVGLESTVVDLVGPAPRLLRPGGLARARLEALIGPLAERPAFGPLRAPGMLDRHYAPKTPLRLNATRVGAEEGLLAFGPHPLPGAKFTSNLSPRGDLDEAAHNLFAMLHDLDAERPRAIAVMPIPEEGLGEAINDRLRRAATA